MTSLIEIKHLKKAFNEHLVLKDINLTIEPHSVTCILGPSGAGKSTLLRCINQLDQSSDGEIIFRGENTFEEKYDIRAMREKVGMVFQHFNLFPHKTCLQNITLPLEVVANKGKATAKNLALDMLDRVGLKDKADDYPHNLSGGQQQRIAIARSLAMQPLLMLFDEPTSALDPELVGDVLLVMQQLAKEKMTMIVVTHEMNFAREVADRVVFMVDGQIIEDSSSENFFKNPKTERAQKFLARSM